jgi:hypothetical protein
MINMKKVTVIHILLGIIVCLSVAGCSNAYSIKETSFEKEKHMADFFIPSKDFRDSVSYNTASYYGYTYYDRNLYLADFVDLTYAEITEIIGESNGIVGSGITSPYYQLADDTIISFPVIGGAVVLTIPDGRRFFNRRDTDYTYKSPVDNSIKQIVTNRVLYFKSFAKIQSGITYKEVVKVLGEPSGFTGDAPSMPYYQLVDNSYIVLHFDVDIKNKYSTLIDLTIIDPAGREYVAIERL